MIDFLGDIYLDKAYKIESDLNDVIVNLEYPLSCQGSPEKDKVNLCQDESYIRGTFEKLPIAVCLANNHIMDYGEEAFSHTIAYLKNNNIAYFGAGNKQNNFNNPCIINSSRKIIALLGYSCPSTHAVFGNESKNGSALLDTKRVLEDIGSVRSKVDFIVIQLHWGDEEIKYPKPEDVQKARAFIDAGADLIIGHHAHVIQSHELYHGKHIFYGLGNFLFPNLLVPSEFDGMKFKSTYKKIQNRKNRESIVVNLNNDLTIEMKTTFFDDKKVRFNKNISIPKWIPIKNKSYNFYYSFWLKKKKIQNFISDPKIPSREQLIRFFK